MPNLAVLEQIKTGELIQSVDAAALTLAVAARPEHATTLRALSPARRRHRPTGRHLDDDHSRRAGIAAGPLTPSVTYEFWLVGHNSQGDGPESNHAAHAVPVGP